MFNALMALGLKIIAYTPFAKSCNISKHHTIDAVSSFVHDDTSVNI